MELVDQEKDAGSYSLHVWYSFELFVPVIDVGVAKKWHPKPNTSCSPITLAFTR